MPLTDTAIRNAKAKKKPYKLSDEKGLYLLVNKAGKYFRFDYRTHHMRPLFLRSICACMSFNTIFGVF